MKKLLALLLVLAVVGVANATVISTQGSLFRLDVTTDGEINPGDTVGVELFAGSDLAVSSMLQTVLNISSAASISGVTQSNSGHWSTYNASISAVLAGFDVNVDGSLPGDIATGQSIYSFSFVAGGPGVVILDAIAGSWSGQDAVVGPVDGYYGSGAVYGLPYSELTVVPVPEPATMAILGLGALLLRRKK